MKVYPDGGFTRASRAGADRGAYRERLSAFGLIMFDQD
jgi:hypothetical protein